MKRSLGARRMSAWRQLPLLLAVAFGLASAGSASAQIPGLSPPSSTAAAQPASPPDPLKRETPRGCVLVFIKTAAEERYNVAVQYFQPSTARRRPSLEDEEELASQLFAVLSLKFTGPLDFISNDPLGHLDDNLPPDQEKIGGFRGVSEDFPLYLVRAEEDRKSTRLNS